MGKHKQFWDNAGYRQHCWECKHAKGWRRVNTIDGHEARCKLTGAKVGKYDSPNNPCSIARCCLEYERD